jgi:uncharacterized protein (TIGR03437 family)
MPDISKVLARSFVLLVLASAALAQGQAGWRVAVLGGRVIAYQDVDGLAIVDGDIILGSVEEVEAASGAGPEAARAIRGAAIRVNPDNTPPLWPNATIFYQIDSNVPNQQRILNAIEHWNTRTPIRLAPRTGQPNYVRFVRSASNNVCSSSVGMIGGQQLIGLADACTTGNVIHEIGHAAGLDHEQNRPDRNDFVTFIPENSSINLFGQSSQAPWTGGGNYYDYDSIMHYSPLTGTANYRSVLQSVPLGIPFGVRTTLSAGDIDAVSRMYGQPPRETTITTIPAALPIVVDGQTYTSPRTFDWPPGSTHTVSVEERLGTNPRHVFVRWTDGGARSHTITAAANRTVYAATFAREFLVRTGVASGNGTVNVFPRSADGFYPAGTSIRIQAIPALSERFLEWTGDDPYFWGQPQGSGKIELDLHTTVQFLANFTAQPLSVIDSDPPGLPLAHDGTADYTPVHQVWTPGSTHVIGTLASVPSLDGGTRHRFLGWADGAGETFRSVTASADGGVYTARFAAEHFLSLAWTSRGRVVPLPGSNDGYFRQGATVRLDAAPDPGGAIQYWLGDSAGRGNTKTVGMDRQRLSIAVFGSPIAILPVNAASYLATPYYELGGAGMVAHEVLTLIGDNIGPREPAPGVVESNGRLASQLDGVRVLFDNTPAPIVRAGPNAIDVVVPGDFASKRGATITVLRNNAITGRVGVGNAGTAPGVFTENATGRGQALAANQDGSPNGVGNPAAAGSVVTLRATGAGAMDRAVPDGQIMGRDQVRPRARVQARIGGVPAEVLYAGSAEGLVHGDIVVRVRVPESLLAGQHPVQLVVGAFASPPGVTIAVKE